MPEGALRSPDDAHIRVEQVAGQQAKRWRQESLACHLARQSFWCAASWRCLLGELPIKL